MNIKILSSREFNLQIPRGLPRGRRAHVLLSIEEYRRTSVSQADVVDARNCIYPIHALTETPSLQRRPSFTA